MSPRAAYLALPLFTVAAVGVIRAERVPVLPDDPANYADIALPAYLLENQIPGNSPFQNAAADNDSTPADNPTTDDGATLGRVLFYDINLSANGTVSCASCHDQSAGFSDSRQLSLGFAGGETRRHSMSLTNARFNDSGKYFWDERADSLEAQVLMPFQDEVEMGLTLEQLVSIVSAQDYYPTLFTHAFGDDTIDADRIARALAQFVRSMVSTNSRYDQGRSSVNSPTDPFPNFTAQENQGKAIFYGVGRNGPSCIDCHTTEAFISPGLFTPHASTTTGATNNGLDRVSTNDLGIAESTGNVNDTGRFRVPSLRNVAVTAPFMHDGRFNTLREVMDFYARDIQPHAQLAEILQPPPGQQPRIGLNNNDRNALVAFLRTLTDETLLTDAKFSDPFVEVTVPDDETPTTPTPEPEPDPEPDPQPEPDPVVVTPPPALSNLSSRAYLSTTSGAMVSGFVVSGDAPKTLLIRGIGPSLATFGLNDALPRPQLSLFALGNDTPLATAGAWHEQPDATDLAAITAQLGAFTLSTDAADSALLVTLDPGIYTVHLRDRDGLSGNGLIEVYDADAIAESEMANLSVRADLTRPGEVLLPGFVVPGDTPRTFLLRAVGPALADFGLTTAADNPRLTVLNANGATVVTNDDWDRAGNATQIEDATQAVGAFALPANSRDAATVVALPPGAYTVRVDSPTGSTGTVLIELYPVTL
ncbi:cytochrome c peroxidase [Actomonas aquatica]|uniref:Cytochrome c peroxidase n=1 Tax=Actomonas aquatica TaxID=2866162 RepID=A0ABZ1C8K6_9BACT|nr:cytochrome c peroxidase [Opitutus sp. WL0086]WRQ87710.1 cytochrome c peroxidase [Opitutus sp. WL0086]